MTLWQGLRHLPSLRELRLQGFNVGSGMPASALNCSGLQGLTLVACTADEWPQAALHLYSECPLALERCPAFCCCPWRVLRRSPRVAVPSRSPF